VKPELRQRVLVAIIVAPVTILAAWYGGVILTLGVIGVALLASWELCDLIEQAGFVPQRLLALFLAIVLPLAAHFQPQGLAADLTVTVAIFLSLLIQLWRGNRRGALASWALSLAGSLYVSWLLSHFILLRQLPLGDYWLLFALLVTWVCDSAAYTIGSAFGRRRLAPQISPKKSWEGAIAGIVAAGIVGLVATSWLAIPLFLGGLIGFVAGLGAVVGDLAESLIKRQAGVKDSGTLFPGHGGMLDRVDSLLFVVAMIFYCARWLTP